MMQRRYLSSPWQRPPSDWLAIFQAAWKEQSEDNISLVAAGVSFFGFLALVPLLGALVLGYGVIATPETVVRNVRHLSEVMPVGAAKLVGDQLMNAVTASAGKKGAGLMLALGVALFGARSAAGGVITALNIVYEERETRGFLLCTIVALGITAASVLLSISAAITAAAIGRLSDVSFVPAGLAAFSAVCLTQVLLVALGAGVAATLYRFGPAHRDAAWQWLTPGSVFSSLGWVLLTLAFKVYAANFGRFDVTYGSLSAVVVMLTWLYLSSFVFLFGAELNSELENDNKSHSPD